MVRKSETPTGDILCPHECASAKMANIRVPRSTCDRRQWWSMALFLCTEPAIVVETNTYQTRVLQTKSNLAAVDCLDTFFVELVSDDRHGAGNVGADGTPEPHVSRVDFSTKRNN